MKWGEAIAAVIGAFATDYNLSSALGGAHVYRNGAFREKQVPSVEWFIVAAEVRENTEQMTVQLDIWAHTYAEAVAIEELVRAVLQRETPQTLGGIPMFTLLQGSQDLPDPEPELIHRVLEFIIEPAREFYL